MTIPIQEEPESTIGRKPGQFHAGEKRAPAPGPVARSGVALRREEGDEGEAAGEIREREQDEPQPLQELDE